MENKNIKMKDIKKIDLKEFIEIGYLQEVNRCFLHPLGLALEVRVDDKTGVYSLGDIWDYREDKEGIFFDLKNSNTKRLEGFYKKITQVAEQYRKMSLTRMQILGFVIEPLPLDEDNTG